MQTIDEQPETIHLYVMREKEPKPSIFPIALSALCLAVLVAFCVLVPYKQPETRITLRVPAVLLPLKMFTSTTAIIPTGIKVYPAVTAHGILTITNGSIIGQSIPAGFTVQGVVTDTVVYVPGGNANGYGWAQVSAHALVSGHRGNLPPYSINSVVGSSVYIRNLSAFSGGKDAYPVKFITSNDRDAALSKARTILISKITGLHYPCQETKYTPIYTKLYISWRCQFVTYAAPSFLHIISVKLIGKEVLISGWFIPPLKRYWVK